jgi:hypothetical protein
MGCQPIRMALAHTSYLEAGAIFSRCLMTNPTLKALCLMLGTYREIKLRNFGENPILNYGRLINHKECVWRSKASS